MDGEPVLFEGVAFPLGEGLDDFHLFARQIFQIEADRTFDAVKIVVEAAALCDKQWS